MVPRRADLEAEDCGSDLWRGSDCGIFVRAIWGFKESVQPTGYPSPGEIIEVRRERTEELNRFGSRTAWIDNFHSNEKEKGFEKIGVGSILEPCKNLFSP